jgi:hypothetical protein
MQFGRSSDLYCNVAVPVRFQVIIAQRKLSAGGLLSEMTYTRHWQCQLVIAGPHRFGAKKKKKKRNKNKNKKISYESASHMGFTTTLKKGRLL